MRRIIHLDMDCFYAAIEIREQPVLLGKPVAVGGLSERGVLTTCNYEARRYGCRSAMPTYQARRLCPELKVLPPQFDLYRTESYRIRKILRSYTPLLEPLSLDEAYLDISELSSSSWDMATAMRKEIFETTELVASAGIAPNKMLAKVASDWRKPNGQYAITPDNVAAFMQDLPVKKIWGIGPRNAEKLKQQGIETCGKLQKLTLSELHSIFGKFGETLYQLCRGRDDRPVSPHRLRKSLSTERTFAQNLNTLQEGLVKAKQLYGELVEDLRSQEATRPIAKAFVKVKFADFRQTTKECMCEKPAMAVYRDLLAEALARSQQSVRLIGIGVRFREKKAIGQGRQLELSFAGLGIKGAASHRPKPL